VFNAISQPNVHARMGKPLQGGPEGPAVRDLPTPATAEHRLAIATGISRRLIAARFKVSADAAWRHGREHLTAEIRAALATKVLAREGDMHRILLKEGSGVVEALKAIRARFSTCSWWPLICVRRVSAMQVTGVRSPFY